MPRHTRTDSRGRLLLPGHPDEDWLIEELADGTFRVEPAKVVSAAQFEYDNTPELQELLTRAASSPSVGRRRASA
jgi:hypothetical protein